MQFDLVRPCKDCPFRTDVPPYLRPGRVEQIANHLERGTFPCHETTGAKGGHKWHRKHQQHCAGAMIAQLKSGLEGDALRSRRELELIDPAKLDTAAPVNDLRAFIAHHGGNPEALAWRVNPCESSSPSSTPTAPPGVPAKARRSRSS